MQQYRVFCSDDCCIFPTQEACEILRLPVQDPIADVTGLKLFNLSDQALAFQRTFGEIGNLLARLDNRDAAHDLEPLDQAEPEYQYPGQQPHSHIIHEARENAG